MGLRRCAAAGLSVAVLALLGTACEPTGTPKMQLELDIGPSGTYEVLTGVIAVDVSVSCTRPVTVYLEASFQVPYGDSPLYSYPGRYSRTAVQCPGPAGQTFTTKWKWPYSAPTSRVIYMYGETYWQDSWGTIWAPVVDRDVDSDGQTVTFTRILCWPGAPTCTSA